MNFIDLLISMVLGLIMFGVGTSLSISDFKHLFKQPKSLSLGLLLQMVFLPIFAFSICMIAPIKEEFKVGLVILSLCPGGTTSNFISYLLGLKTALSVSLTAVNSLLILITIPIGVNLALRLFLHTTDTFEISIYSTIQNVFTIIILPLIFGIFVCAKYNELIKRFKPSIKTTSIFLLASIFAIKFFAGKNNGGSGINHQDFISLLPITLGFNLSSIIISYGIALKNGIKKMEAITIGIEVGLQNTALALLISSVLLSNEELAKPALVYAMFSFFTTFTFGFITKKSLEKVFSTA